MTLSKTQELAEPVETALHRALQVAWQAGYDKAMEDVAGDKDFGGGRVLRRRISGELFLGDDE